MKSPTYKRGYILVDKALISGFESLRILNKDAHLKRARIIDLVQLGHHKRWQPFPASERWLCDRWNTSLGYASRLIKKLIRNSTVRLLKRGSQEGDPRVLQLQKPKRYFMLPRMVLDLPANKRSMAADLFRRASEVDIQYGEMSITTAACATRWGCSISTARSFIRELHELGLLQVVQTASKTQPTIIRMAKAEPRQHPLPFPKRPPKPRPKRSRKQEKRHDQQINLEIKLKEKGVQKQPTKSRIRKKIFGVSHACSTSRRFIPANLDTYSIDIIEHLVQRFTVGHVLGALKRHMISIGFTPKALQKTMLWLVESQESPSGWIIADDITAGEARRIGLKALPRCTRSNLEGMLPFLIGAK
jgi:hypothetical protein